MTLLIRQVESTPNGAQKPAPKRLDITEIWKDAPILKGTTKFDPLPDVGTIMITGGAGFMYEIRSSALRDATNSQKVHHGQFVIWS